MPGNIDKLEPTDKNGEIRFEYDSKLEGTDAFLHVIRGSYYLKTEKITLRKESNHEKIYILDTLYIKGDILLECVDTLITDEVRVICSNSKEDLFIKEINTGRFSFKIPWNKLIKEDSIVLEFSSINTQYKKIALNLFDFNQGIQRTQSFSINALLSLNKDKDEDKIPDNCDPCISDEDLDEDGIPDCQDDCIKKVCDKSNTYITYEVNSDCECVPKFSDQDADGIIDSRDKCPGKFGDKKNGCPNNLQEYKVLPGLRSIVVASKKDKKLKTKGVILLTGTVGTNILFWNELKKYKRFDELLNNPPDPITQKEYIDQRRTHKNQSIIWGLGFLSLYLIDHLWKVNESDVIEKYNKPKISLAKSSNTFMVGLVQNSKLII